MRIHYVGPVPPYQGGIAQHGAAICEALRRAGHEVRIDSWQHQYPWFLYPGTQRAGEGAPPEGTKFMLRWWDPVSWIRVGLRARQADVVLLPWVTPFLSVPLAIMTRLSGPSTRLAIVHNAEPHERFPLSRTLTRLTFSAIDGVLCHSRSEQRIVEEMFPGLLSDVTMLPPLVPVEAAPLPQGPPWRLLFMGFIRPYKGLQVALEALKELVDAGDQVQLTIAGEFWQGVEEWEQLVGDLGIEPYVDIRPGYVGDADVSELLADHHVVLAPYTSATQSGLVPLAYAAARPIVGTTVGGLVEQIDDRRSGVLSQPGDPASLADAIRWAVQHQDELAAGAAQRVPTWDAVGEAVIRLALTTKGGVATAPQEGGSGSRGPSKFVSRTLRRSPTRERTRSSHVVTDVGSRKDKARKIVEVLRDDVELPGSRVLEVGAGSGVIASELAARVGPSGSVTAVDVVDARLITDGYEFEVVWDAALPFPNASFDLVISNHVLEHVGDIHEQTRHLAEIARVLSDDGLLYLAVPNRWSPWEAHYRLPALGWVRGRLSDLYLRITGRGTWYDCRPVGRRELQLLLDRAGLSFTERTRQAVELMASIEDPGPLKRLILSVVRGLYPLFKPIVPTLVYLAQRRTSRP